MPRVATTELRKLTTTISFINIYMQDKPALKCSTADCRHNNDTTQHIGTNIRNVLEQQM